MVVILSNPQQASVPAMPVKKDEQRPKRPLSAYNLFYRFKRNRILEAHKSGEDSEEAVNRLILAVPGLEDQHASIVDGMSPEDVQELRRAEILSALQENLSPKDNRNRSHRKSHGALSFLEMNKIMVASWKAIDDYTRSVFEELAEKGRRMYHIRVAEFEKKYPNAPKKTIKKSSNSTSAPKKAHSKTINVKPVSPAKLTLTPKTNNKSRAPVISPVTTALDLDLPLFTGTPQATTKSLHVVSPVTPNTSMDYGHFFGEDLGLDLDLDMNMELPLFSEILDIGGVSELDLCPIPFSYEKEPAQMYQQSKPTADDFLKLIDVLDECL